MIDDDTGPWGPTPGGPPWQEDALSAGWFSPDGHDLAVIAELDCVLTDTVALAYEHLPAEHADTLARLLEQQYGVPITPPSPETMPDAAAQVSLW